MMNIGSMRNRGWEFSLETINVNTKNFQWTTSFNIAFNRNTVTALTSGQQSLLSTVYWDERFNSQYPYITQVGKPSGMMYGFIYEGTYKADDFVGNYLKDGIPYVSTYNKSEIRPGDPKYRDVNGDGIIDDADTKLIGTTDPGWMASMTNIIKFKDFDLNFMFNGMFDRIMQDPTEMAFGISGGGISASGYNALRSVQDRWTPNNPSTTRPSSFYNTGHNYTAGDFFYQKAWFIRLQNLSLGYTLPKSLIAKTKVLSNVRISASINNLFVITPYDGLDPETDAYAAAYPNARTFSFGIDVTF